MYMWEIKALTTVWLIAAVYVVFAFLTPAFVPTVIFGVQLVLFGGSYRGYVQWRERHDELEKGAVREAVGQALLWPLMWPATAAVAMLDAFVRVRAISIAAQAVQAALMVLDDEGEDEDDEEEEDE